MIKKIVNSTKVVSTFAITSPHVHPHSSFRNDKTMKFHLKTLSSSSLIYIRWFIVMVSFHLVVPWTFDVDAQAPANDLCINAQPIMIGSSPDPVTFNTLFATKDVDVTSSDCSSETPPFSPGIWLNFTGTGGRIVARACARSYYSTSITIFDGDCNATLRQCVASTDVSCGQERFIFDTQLGLAYSVLVQSYYYASVDVSIFSAPPAPANDLCINAQSITIGSAPDPVTFDTTYATTDVEVTTSVCQNDIPPSSPGIWFNFTGTGGRIVARACLQSSSSNSTFITIFSGGCNATARCVAATYASCEQGRFVFDTQLGTAYRVLVQSGFIDSVDVSIVSAPPAPPNDLCINAQPITIGSAPVTFNTTYASTDMDAISDCLEGTPAFSPGIWFNFTGIGGRIVARACAQSSYHTTGNSAHVTIFSGGCSATARRCLAYTYYSCDQIVFVFDTQFGNAYHVLVQSYYQESVKVLIFTDGGTTQPNKAPTKSPSNFFSKAPSKNPTKSPSKTPTKGTCKGTDDSHQGPDDFHQGPDDFDQGTTTSTKVPTTSTKVPTKVPSATPVVVPTSCGLFGSNFFCPRRGNCGILRRLFNKNNEC